MGLSGEAVSSTQYPESGSARFCGCYWLEASSERRFFMSHFFHIDDLSRQRAGENKLYLEFLRVPALSAGVYILPKGANDPQKPHREDEMYYVVRGRARMQIGSDQAEVRPGSVIFVEAELEHRFYDVQEELEVLVFFAPAERE
jgi:mannose-6-phosphate isomerase-like protein (cupin superfamily)